MTKKYRRIALWLVICMVVGLLPGMGKTVAGSKTKVKLVLTDTFVTGKTYDLKQGKHRQLHVRIQNSKGKASLKYKSKDSSIASVTKKGYIEAKSLGTTKIIVKVSMNSGKKVYTKKVWVKIHVTDPDPEPTPSTPGGPEESVSPATSPSGDTVFPAGSLKAFVQINGSAQATFEMSILDSAAGRKFYSSLPKVLYMTDQNRVSKVAEDTQNTYDMEEYKPGTLTPGDFMLYGTNKYEMVYAEHRTGYAYTRIGKVLNAAKMAAIIGTGAVSVSIVRGTVPTSGPTASGMATQTPAPWGTGTPWPWVTNVPSGSAVSASPGSSSSAPAPVASAGVTVPPGVSTAPVASVAPAPASSTGDKFRITINGNVFDFNVEQSSTVARTMYATLGSGYRQLEFRPVSSEDRYAASLPAGEVYNDDSAVPPVWPTGSLVLMGNNEVSVQLKTKTNTSNRRSTIIGRLDTDSIVSPEGSAEALLRYYFSEDPTSATFSHG